MGTERASEAVDPRPFVLVIDDDHDIADSIAEVLGSGGYDVGTAPDGTSALAAAELRAVGLVLLDWRLPAGPSGASLVRRLHALCGASLPIVVLSADPTSLAEARAEHVTDYLPKPFDVADLMHVVDHYCRIV
jgi:DNA-binding response OmpR family regulator